MITEEELIKLHNEHKIRSELLHEWETVTEDLINILFLLLQNIFIIEKTLENKKLKVIEDLFLSKTDELEEIIKKRNLLVEPIKKIIKDYKNFLYYEEIDEKIHERFNVKLELFNVYRYLTFV